MFVFSGLGRSGNENPELKSMGEIMKVIKIKKKKCLQNIIKNFIISQTKIYDTQELGGSPKR